MGQATPRRLPGKFRTKETTAAVTGLEDPTSRDVAADLRRDAVVAGTQAQLPRTAGTAKQPFVKTYARLGAQKVSACQAYHGTGTVTITLQRENARARKAYS